MKFDNDNGKEIKKTRLFFFRFVSFSSLLLFFIGNWSEYQAVTIKYWKQNDMKTYILKKTRIKRFFSCLSMTLAPTHSSQQLVAVANWYWWKEKKAERNTKRKKLPNRLEDKRERENWESKHICKKTRKVRSSFDTCNIDWNHSLLQSRDDLHSWMVLLVIVYPVISLSNLSVVNHFLGKIRHFLFLSSVESCSSHTSILVCV